MITNYQLDLQIKWGANVFYNYSFNSFVRGLLFFLIQTWLLLNSIFQSLTKLPGPHEQLQHDLVDLKHVLSQSLQLLQAAVSLLLSFFAYLIGIQFIKSNFWKIVQNMNIRIKKKYFELSSLWGSSETISWPDFAWILSQQFGQEWHPANNYFCWIWISFILR